MPSRVALLSLVLAATACRRQQHATPSADAAPRDAGGWHGSPAAAPSAPITAWSQLAPILEPCIAPGRGMTDASVFVRIVGGAAHILNVSCTEADVDMECLQRGIASAKYAPAMTTDDERLLITRRATGLAPRSGAVRVRTAHEIFIANTSGSAHDGTIVSPPCW